jgi:hypothetical protein
MEDKWYVAESYRDLEKVGDIFEKDGKEYITVILKSGREHAARVYRPAKPKAQTTSSNRITHITYDLFTELGFKPNHFIYLVRAKEEEKLQGICKWYPSWGAYLKCTDNIFDLPFGCEIRKLYWSDVCSSDFMHLKSKEEIAPILKQIWRNKEVFNSEIQNS